MPPPLWLKGMGGLGDNVYQRPLVRHLAAQRRQVWLSTPYPELYTDLPEVIPVRWATLELRCQLKNMARQAAGVFQPPPQRAQAIRLHYALKDLRGTISQELERAAGTPIPRASWRFDLPPFAPPQVRFRRPYAVIRPVTIRREWPNPARNPDPEYIALAARELRRRGFRVVCVADIDGKQEWAAAPLPEADRYLVHGELALPQMMALVQGAAVVIGPVGWIVPTTIAMRKPAVVICGGLGAHNSPQVLVDPRMDASRIRFLLPEPYCATCRDPKHVCQKAIPEFAAKLSAALDVVLQ
jgi:hypothetical protein